MFNNKYIFLSIVEVINDLKKMYFKILWKNLLQKGLKSEHKLIEILLPKYF